MTVTIGEHSGGQIASLNGGTSTSGDHPGNMTNTSAKKAQQFLVALVLMFAFVLTMTLVAGTSQKVGRGVLAFFLLMLLLQGMTHVNPFVDWVERHPLTPTA